jgi:rare lipoprotein A
MLAFHAMGFPLQYRLARAVTLSCACLFALAGAAAAERAPITYAGQGGEATATQAASLAVNTLSGGDERSYGYGAAQRRSGPVIDLRRDARRSEPVVFEPPTAQDDDEDVSEGPLSLAPAPQQLVQTQAETEQGAQPWLERERVGPPYEANGRWYVPTPEPGYEQTGTASWYGPQFHGQRTASGEVFDETALTAAHPTLPIPSLVQVTNLENGREVIVRVNDRGPFTGERLIDLSRGAAQVLGFDQAGHARVHVRYLGPAPRRVNADGSPAPASVQAPATPAPAQAEEGPLAAQTVETADLAGAPTGADRPVFAPAPAMGRYFVQVGAYSDPANAQRVRDAAASAGPVVVDVRTAASGTELFRVRVGPWENREQAEAAQRTLSTLGYAESVVAGP